MMGKWPVGQWIVDAMRFQKIFGLYSVECHKVEKWSGRLGSGLVWFGGCVWVMGEWAVGEWIVELSENVWFV